MGALRVVVRQLGGTRNDPTLQRVSMYEGQGHGFHGAALATSREEAVGFLAQAH